MKVRVAQQGRRREGLATHSEPSGDVVASGGAVADERLTTPPESCAGVRKGTGEALTGVDASRVWSREIDPNTSGCLRYEGRLGGCSKQDQLLHPRGATSGVPLCRREVRPDPARSLDPVRASKHTSRKTGDPMVGHGGTVVRTRNPKGARW